MRLDMEKFTATNLKSCAQAFADATGLSPSTVAKNAAGDWRFFTKLEAVNPSTITIRKFDAVMTWFDANWPADTKRPQCLDDWLQVKLWEAANNYSASAQRPYPRLSVV